MTMTLLAYIFSLLSCLGSLFLFYFICMRNEPFDKVAHQYTCSSKLLSNCFAGSTPTSKHTYIHIIITTTHTISTHCHIHAPHTTPHRTLHCLSYSSLWRRSSHCCLFKQSCCCCPSAIPRKRLPPHSPLLLVTPFELSSVLRFFCSVVASITFDLCIVRSCTL